MCYAYTDSLWEVAKIEEFGWLAYWYGVVAYIQERMVIAEGKKYKKGVVHNAASKKGTYF